MICDSEDQSKLTGKKLVEIILLVRPIWVCGTMGKSSQAFFAKTTYIKNKNHCHAAFKPYNTGTAGSQQKKMGS
jgi:hypothetical protein